MFVEETKSEQSRTSQNWEFLKSKFILFQNIYQQNFINIVKKLQNKIY